ncbi:MAG: LysM domain-containing protein [Chloroflexota bacterium]
MSRVGPCLVGVLAFAVSGCLTVAPTDPTPTPPPTPVITPTPTPEPTNRTYVVRSGDTLLIIAQRFGLTLGQLMAANPSITDPDRIRVGQVIVIPPPGAPETGPRSASFRDGSDDAVDADDEQVSTPGYADITSASAETVDDRRIQVELALVNAPPDRMDLRSRRCATSSWSTSMRTASPTSGWCTGNDVEGESGFSQALLDRRSGKVPQGRRVPRPGGDPGRRVVFTVRRRASARRGRSPSRRPSARLSPGWALPTRMSRRAWTEPQTSSGPCPTRVGSRSPAADTGAHATPGGPTGAQATRGPDGTDAPTRWPDSAGPPRPGSEPQLVQDVGDVGLDGPGRDDEARPRSPGR